MNKMKRNVVDGLIRSGLVSRDYLIPNPFKVLEWRALLRPVALQPADVVLDVGCGRGLQTALLALRTQKVIGIDVSEDAIRRARSDRPFLPGGAKVEFRCTAVENAGFPADTFDKVISLCVLEHIPDHVSVLRHCHRVLKPGGQIAFSVDSLATLSDPSVIEEHRVRYAVCRYFEPEGIRSDFEAAGFRQVHVRPVGISDLAARWFVRGIQKEFRYRYGESWWKYQVLRWAETCSGPAKAGLYLAVNAVK